MAMVRVVALAAAVLGVSFALAACGGESGGTTTVATQPPPETTSEPEETTSKPEETTAKEKTTPEKTTPEKASPEKAGKAEKGGASSAELAEGKQVFTANGCGSCHTLAAANATGVVGPNLDEALPGKSESYIQESIVDPNAKIAPGYSAGIMPPTFGSSLSSAELKALVAFLQQSAGQ
jgi:mono/diheme cytochrome c family protein